MSLDRWTYTCFYQPTAAPCHQSDPDIILLNMHMARLTSLSILSPLTMASDNYTDPYLTYQQPNNLNHAMENQHAFYQSQPFDDLDQSFDFSCKHYHNFCC